MNVNEHLWIKVKIADPTWAIASWRFLATVTTIVVETDAKSHLRLPFYRNDVTSNWIITWLINSQVAASANRQQSWTSTKSTVLNSTLLPVCTGPKSLILCRSRKWRGKSVKVSGKTSSSTVKETLSHCRKSTLLHYPKTCNFYHCFRWSNCTCHKEGNNSKQDMSLCHLLWINFREIFNPLKCKGN